MMRYRILASFQGAPYEAGVGPDESDVVLFAACPPPEELRFEPATGHWRKRISRSQVQALYESRPVGMFRSERCIVLDELTDRLHIVYLGHDALRAAQLGYWEVDRGVFELITPRQEVTDIVEQRLPLPIRSDSGQHTRPGPMPSDQPEDYGTPAGNSLQDSGGDSQPFGYEGVRQEEFTTGPQLLDQRPDLEQLASNYPQEPPVTPLGRPEPSVRRPADYSEISIPPVPELPLPLEAEALRAASSTARRGQKATQPRPAHDTRAVRRQQQNAEPRIQAAASQAASSQAVAGQAQQPPVAPTPSTPVPPTPVPPIPVRSTPVVPSPAPADEARVPVDLAQAATGPAQAAVAPAPAVPMPAQAAPTPVQAVPMPVQAAPTPVQTTATPVPAAPEPAQAIPVPVQAAPEQATATPVPTAATLSKAAMLSHAAAQAARQAVASSARLKPPTAASGEPSTPGAQDSQPRVEMPAEASQTHIPTEPGKEPEQPGTTPDRAPHPPEPASEPVDTQVYGSPAPSQDAQPDPPAATPAPPAAPDSLAVGSVPIPVTGPPAPSLPGQVTPPPPPPELAEAATADPAPTQPIEPAAAQPAKPAADHSAEAAGTPLAGISDLPGVAQPPSESAVPSWIPQGPVQPMPSFDTTRPVHRIHDITPDQAAYAPFVANEPVPGNGEVTLNGTAAVLDPDLTAPTSEPVAQAEPDPAAPTRRRRSTKRRLPTQKIFSDLATQAAIPAMAYAIGEEVDGAMCLVRTDDGFEVFNAAAGARHEVRVFQDEESAYFYLFGVLVAESVRTGALAPRN